MLFSISIHCLYPAPFTYQKVMNIIPAKPIVPAFDFVSCRKTTLDLPQDKLSVMAVKLFMLGALVWDYADTVCDIASNMRLYQTKALCRCVHKLKRDYDSFRSMALSHDYLITEQHIAMQFEDLCRLHFRKLIYSISSDKSTAGLDSEYLMLVKSVYMAMAVLGTMRMYATECDRWMRHNGVHGHSIMPEQIQRLAILLPQFAGDTYNRNIPSLHITSSILFNELNSIEIDPS